jgi:DNA replication and repair protein RecF
MVFPAQIVSEIDILYFKQYRRRQFYFHNKLNIITGNNGLGKTNLLDAIYYNCFLKSYFSKSDQYIFPFGGDHIELITRLKVDNDAFNIKISNKKEQKKQAWLNHIPIEKQTEVSGRFPIVFIEPYDHDLITGNADARRRFLDITLSLSNPVYLQKLMEYQKILKQKNALLKQLSAGRIDETLLAIYTEQLIGLNDFIYKERQEFIQQFNIIFKENYRNIFDGNESIELEYESNFHRQNIAQFIHYHKQKEMQAQRTLAGIHNDDLLFTLNGYAAKKVASQGQQKTIVLALKFAQYAYISQHAKRLPLLFLDDIFDKLDIERIKKILKMTHLSHFGQIFITYTDANRILGILQELNIVDYKHITISELPTPEKG